ncbi:hypothetical protein SORBI_3008G013700 [Sorghum bicolor]|uniref:Uncharacterized protein n=1 Tax=Sorghum bicolor TaxID=4558 RepID=A0A1B6PAT5_SORBI|nr:hypothetical protein SORBI_3008G013700 [Sorghum bicolor]
MNICIHCFDTDLSQDFSKPATLNGMLDSSTSIGAFLPQWYKSDKPGDSTLQQSNPPESI